jgi:NADPH:quinone reductase-like Zn-dependent oxidoreductase
MKAMICTRYGGPEVLQLQEVPQPTPKDNEILVRVAATQVGFGDLTARNFPAITPDQFNMPLPFWLLTRLAFGTKEPKKKILGSEFSGVVAAVGKAVTRYKVGDPVFGYRGPNMGAYAEYLCQSETGLAAPKPANLTFEEAAAIPYGALTALSLLRQAGLQSGWEVLINGASGGIGSAAVQLAKHFGARVTGVCGTPRLGYVQALGADEVIDYTQADFTQNGKRYDLIFDILGKSQFSQVQGSLKPQGILLYASFKMKQLSQALWTGLRDGGQKVKCALSFEKPEDMQTIQELAEAGKLKPIIDRCYPLEQAAEAHRYAEAGGKRGSIVINVSLN